jgi:hypothetical protein
MEYENLSKREVPCMSKLWLFLSKQNCILLAMSIGVFSLSAIGQQQSNQQPINIYGQIEQQQQYQRQQQMVYQTQHQDYSQQQEEQQKKLAEKKRKALQLNKIKEQENEDIRKGGPGVGRSSLIESNLSDEAVNTKLQAEFSGDIYDYSVYEKLPRYITELQHNKITIEALDALDIWEEPIPRLATIPNLPTRSLYRHEVNYYFVSDAMRYLRQSNTSNTAQLREKINRRLDGLLAMEYERMKREVISYNNFQKFTITQRQIFNLIQQGNAVFAAVEQQMANGYRTRFSGHISLQSVKMLFLAQVQSAARIANPHSRLHQLLLNVHGIDPNRFAIEYLRSGNDILAFARGLRQGVELTFIDLFNAVATIYKLTSYTIDNPETAVSLVWDTIAELEPDRIAAAIHRHLLQSYQKLEYGTPAEKGEVIGRIVADVILGATMAPFMSNYHRFSLEEGKEFVARVELLTDLARPVTNEIGSIGRIVRDVRNLSRSGSGRDGALTYLDQIKMLRESRVRIGNFGIGTVLRGEAEQLGMAWVGEGATLHNNYAWISKDKLRQYRPPKFKSNHGYEQANLEWRHTPNESFMNNAHLNIYPDRYLGKE